MKKVIFLDIDGVLNSDEWYEDFFGNELYKKVDKKGNQVYDHDLSFKHIALLNSIATCVKDVGIVITSTWRFDMEDTEARLKKQGLTIPIIGITDTNNSAGIYGTVPRGMQIYKWIHDEIKKTGDSLLNYVIFDDDIDMLYVQRNNFIHIDYLKGLTKKDVEKAIQILIPDNILGYNHYI